MSDAGLTNGAFYPHFQSKEELVRETVAAALEAQLSQLRDVLAAGGLEAAIAVYLSAEHRDNPATGCASAALLPELARGSRRRRAASMPSASSPRCARWRRRCRRRPGIRRASCWASSRRSSARFSSPAPSRGAHCRIAILAAGAEAARMLVQPPSVIAGEGVPASKKSG